MANTGFISMAQDIAAVAAQVTVVDGIVDDILVDTEVTLPGEHAVIGMAADAILVDTGTTLPAEHGALSAEHGVIDGIVDAILVDTDATIPAAIAAKAIRGTFKTVYHDSEAGAFEEILGLTSKSGKLFYVSVFTGAGTTEKVRITIDGITSLDITIAADLSKCICPAVDAGNWFKLDITDLPYFMNIEFKDNLKIEHYRSAGADFCRLLAYYIED